MYNTLKMVIFLQCFDENEPLERMVFPENDIDWQSVRQHSFWLLRDLVVHGFLDITAPYKIMKIHLWYQNWIYPTCVILHNLREKFDQYIIL